MRKSKVQMTAAALMAVILLGGCGEAPYELNDKEEAVIVNYASHVVSKYNTYQREGLMHVAQEAEITEEAEELPAQTETPQEDMQSTESFSGVEGADGSAQLPTAELTQRSGTCLGRKDSRTAMWEAVFLTAIWRRTIMPCTRMRGRFI